MCILKRHAQLASRLIIVSTLAFCSFGCMNPYYGNRGMYGYGYNTPYAQPSYGGQPAYNSAPGSLVIPESSGAPYAPGSLGSTYEDDIAPSDDFSKSPNGQFYEGDVPDPKDVPKNQFDYDLGGPSTFFDPEAESYPADGGIQLASGSRLDSSIQQVSGRLDHGEYGFDTKDYRWLRGVLRYDSASNDWAVTYSLAARDRFGGTLTLALSADQINGLNEGDNIDVLGYVDDSVRGQQGRAIYRVSSISRTE